MLNYAPNLNNRFSEEELAVRLSRVENQQHCGERGSGLKKLNKYIATNTTLLSGAAN